MKIICKHIILFILVIFVNSKGISQTLVPLGPFYERKYFYDETTPPSIKPVLHNNNIRVNDKILNQLFYLKDTFSNNWFIRKLFYEHLIQVNTSDFKLDVSPLFILNYGKETVSDHNIYRNTRGIFLQANIGQKIGFYSAFYENQARFVNHVEQYADFMGVVPGEGFHKDYRKTGFDFAWSEGVVCWIPVKNLNFRFGHGKNFIGNGYRSILLSDNSFNYPYFFIQYKNEKISYASWYAVFMNPDIPYPRIIANHIWLKKYAAFHYFTYKPYKILEIGLFDGSILKTNNSKLWLYNPVMLINMYNREANTITGINANMSYFGATLYAQYNFNRYDKKVFGYQTGLKYKKHFEKIRLAGFTEFNLVTPTSSYYAVDTVKSYTHYSQPLAHPLGSGFKEYIFDLQPGYKSFELEYKLNYAITQNDTTGYLPGLNILSFHYLNSSEDKSYLTIHEFKISYILNPQTNLRITLGSINRKFSFHSNVTYNNFVYIGLQTCLFNRYYDF